MSGLVVYNTQTRTKEEFKPMHPPKVAMYCCGPTVYDLLHVGNFRGAIFYNFVRNWLEHLGYKVTFVYNYTDVDDKIIARAKRDGSSAQIVAAHFVGEFETDFQRLKLRAHDKNPKVSETMPEIIDYIAELIAKEKAYATAKGDVWFSIKSFAGYGKLSNRDPEELRVSVRAGLVGGAEEDKKDPLDFALWKSAKPDEPSWDSPWGKGRPGWHIECSAMVRKHLGEQIDIHGGGLDLMFPHHENEIAQSEACTGHTYSNYWLHNNMLNFGGAKMSKSVGNIMTARSFMDTYNPEILKYLMLSSHYRSVSDLSEGTIELAIKALARVYSSLNVADKILQDPAATAGAAPDASFVKLTDEAWASLTTSLNDDFNTPEMMARLFEIVRQFNAQVKMGVKVTPAIAGKALAFKNFTLGLGKLGSLFQEPPAEFLMALDNMLLKSLHLERGQIDQLVAARWQARTDRDFKKSDEIRDQLVKLGIAVMDTAQGTHWEVAK